jgi:protein-L-isoaspartate O-methyltransferase
MQLIEKYQQSQLLITANELKIIPLLLSGVETAEELTSKLKVSTRGVERLLFALKNLGLVTIAKQRHTASLRFKPTKLATQCFGNNGLIRNWTAHQGTLFRLWADLPRSIRDDAPLLRDTHDIDVESYAKGLMEQYELSPRKLHDIIDLRGHAKLLDIGGGVGHYSIMAALDNKELRASIFDKPEIAEIARHMVSQYHLESRISVIEGDAIKSAWPPGHNVILLSNILHGRDIPDAQRLLSKAYSSLQEGGRIIVNEWIKGSGQDASLFDLTMLLCTPKGRLWTKDELLKLVREAGFNKKHRWTRLDGTHWVIEAWK